MRLRIYAVIQNEVVAQPTGTVGDGKKIINRGTYMYQENAVWDDRWRTRDGLE